MYTFKLRRGEAVDWATKDTILDEGEPGFEVDTGLFKIGDGNKRWSELRYFVPGMDAEGDPSTPAVEAHRVSETPHPIYDDGPSLYLLYQNAKV